MKVRNKDCTALFAHYKIFNKSQLQQKLDQNKFESENHKFVF